MAKQAATRVKAPTPRRKQTSAKRSTAPAASYDDIARRAFELYMARGATEGDALGDWVRAEKEICGDCL